MGAGVSAACNVSYPIRNRQLVRCAQRHRAGRRVCRPRGWTDEHDDPRQSPAFRGRMARRLSSPGNPDAGDRSADTTRLHQQPSTLEGGRTVIFGCRGFRLSEKCGFSAELLNAGLEVGRRLASRSFWLIAFANFFFGFATTSLSVHIIPYLISYRVQARARQRWRWASRLASPRVAISFSGGSAIECAAASRCQPRFSGSLWRCCCCSAPAKWPP